MILFILCLSIFLGCQAAPTSYDQRQEGSFNVHADLENFLFVFVPTDSLIDDITLFDFKSMARQLLNKNNKNDGDNNEPIMSLDNEGIGERSKTGKPYRVDIVRIPKDKERDTRESNNLNGKDPTKLLDNKVKKIGDGSVEGLEKPETPTKDLKPSLNESEGDRITRLEPAKSQESELPSDGLKIDSRA